MAVKVDLPPTLWPPSPSEFGIPNSEFGGEGKGVGGWGEVESNIVEILTSNLEVIYAPSHC